MRKLTRALSMLLVCCMMFTLLPVKAEAIVIESGNTVEFENFFTAQGVKGESTNGHYSVQGIGVDENGMAYAIMGSDKPSGQLKELTWFAIDPDKSINNNKDVPEEDKIYLDNVTNPHTADESFYEGASLMIHLSDGSNINLVGDKSTEGYFSIPIGDFDALMEKDPTFSLVIDCGENGWDVEAPGWEITVNLSYEIEKEVDKNAAELGDTLTYTIKASNTGDYNIPNSNVWDVLPEWLDLDTVSVKRNGEAWPQKNAGGTGDGWYWDTKESRTIMLDYDYTLKYDKATSKGEVVTYEISAMIDDKCELDTLVNTAYIGGGSLAEKKDDATTVIDASFYIHHIYNDGYTGTKENPLDPGENAQEMRVDKIKITDVNKYLGGKFNVVAKTEVPSLVDGTETTYDGLWRHSTQGKALYGGTFSKTGTDDAPEYTKPYEFAAGESGIEFTPENGAHYYVWEPSNMYLRPFHVTAYHPHKDDGEYHAIAGYPGSSVDRLNYQLFGYDYADLVETNPSEDVYAKIVTENGNGIENGTDSDKKWDTLVPVDYLNRTGFFGCNKFADTLFGTPVENGGCGELEGGQDQTYLPYWVTMDGVKVTGVYDRTVHYQGVGTTQNHKMLSYTRSSTNQNTTLKYGARSNSPLMLSAMYFDNNLTVPGAPAKPNPKSVGVEYDTITAGKSGNVKGLTLTADLSKFDYEDAWFMVKSDKKEVRVDAETVEGLITAEVKLNKFGEGLLYITPYWQSEGEEPTPGAELVLNVEKKMAPVPAEETAADSIGLFADEEYLEIMVTEAPVETEAVEETTEETAETEAAEEVTETEAVEEVTEETEPVEENGKKNDKKNNNKKNDKNDKKNNKKDEVAETEPVVTESVEETVETEPVEETTEASAEVTYEEITTVTFVSSAVCYAEVYVEQESGEVVGFIVQ